MPPRAPAVRTRPVSAFNNAYSEYNGDEHRAFAVAHAAAKKAGDRPGPG